MASNAAKVLDFDIEHFEIGASNAAPALNPSKEVKSNIKKLEPRSDEELRAEEMKALKKSVALLCFVLVIFGIVALQISAGAKNYRLMREIQTAQAALNIAQSENVRLNSELNGITSIAIIDSYATEVLGMSKVENYQIECIDMSDGDSVIYTSDGFGK